MHRLRLTLILLATALSLPLPALAIGNTDELIITELMQSNVDCLVDDLNQFPDSWVEIYNNSDSPVNLKNFAIGLKPYRESAYTLPDSILPPQAYALIYCDKESQGMHTDFRLESDKGGSVYLFYGSRIADKVENLAKQPAPNVSWGRCRYDSSRWGYLYYPTPGEDNHFIMASGVLGAPVFSHTGCVNPSPFTLTLSLPHDTPKNTYIRYTLDGSEPTIKSPLYTKPLPIDSTTVVRAALFALGHITPRATTHSYIILNRQASLPVVSIVTDERFISSDDLGILAIGNNPAEPNYRQDWRRPANVEMFWPGENSAVINQLIETRIKGNHSRSFPLKSMVLYANKRFGTKRLRHEFFPAQAPGLTDWKSIELRNAGNDFNGLHCRDAVMQEIMGMNTDLDWQPGQPSILLINGRYMGLLNIRARSNEDHVYTFHNSLEDIDMVENWNTATEGTIDNFLAFKELYRKNSTRYPALEGMMDMDEFANLMVMNIFFNNLDFPKNNNIMWRPRVEGGRWRWIAKDTDYGLGYNHIIPEYPTLTWYYDHDFDPEYNWGNWESGTKLFTKLMSLKQFFEPFINRCAVYMGDFLTPDNIRATIKRWIDLTADEYPYHACQVDYTALPMELDSELEYVNQWVEQRWHFFYSHLADFYGLGKPVDIDITLPHYHESPLRINGITLNNPEFHGKHFTHSQLHIEAGPDVEAWHVTILPNPNPYAGQPDPAEEFTVNNYCLDITVPDCAKMVITPQTPLPANVDNPTAQAACEVEMFSLDGVGRGRFPTLDLAKKRLAPGLYIAVSGKHVRKIAIR